MRTPSEADQPNGRAETFGAEASDVSYRVRALLERPGVRRSEDLLDRIAEIVGSPRRFGGGLYQKSLG